MSFARIALLAGLAGAFACAGGGLFGPRLHQSALGYEATLPADWQPANAALLDAAQASASASGALETEGSRQILAALRERVKSADSEIFLLEGTHSGSFRENVHVQTSGGSLAGLTREVQATVCVQIEQSYREAVGRPLELHTCEVRGVAASPALFVLIDGAEPGTIVAQHMLQPTERSLLTVTATLLPESLDALRPELDAFVQSIQASEGEVQTIQASEGESAVAP